MRLSVLSRKEIVPGKPLLFLDEVQECGDMLTWVKFLSERHGIDVVLSGSLLGIDEYVSVRSLPVGFLQKLVMHPLRFKEFCMATGIVRQAWQTAEEAIESLVSDPISFTSSRWIDLGSTCS